MLVEHEVGLAPEVSKKRKKTWCPYCLEFVVESLKKCPKCGRVIVKVNA